MKIALVVIDGQNDFCASGNEPNNWPWPYGGKRRGSLFVEGADKEGSAVAAMIHRLKDPSINIGHKLYKIWASLDSHHRMDCSHNITWKGQDGKSPPPFTIVSHKDVLEHVWTPRFPYGVWDGKIVPSHQWALKYTEALEKSGRAVLCLWPVHCEINQWGSNIYHPLAEAYGEWAETTGLGIDFITKGQWRWSEHYSAMRADVIDDTRPETKLNVPIITGIAEADKVLWTGWAGSHCLPWTAMDALTYFGTVGDTQSEDNFFKKSVFFEDASAAVPDIPGAPFKFSEWRKKFLNDVSSRGAEVTTTTKYMIA